ncbi:MAG TPA: adenylate/guanylate cyclase domain-containing protein [Anaerolineales bacterium]|nr:adenylate/guanylate cyclase domain-containing protein [Anaerolineales bacterium]
MTPTPGDANSEMWRKVLTGGEPAAGRVFHFLRRLPSNPRCQSCNAPFEGLGAPIMRAMGRGRSRKNPRYCTYCEKTLLEYQGGAEIELTMLFVDVRGSTTIAEKMNPTDFSRLMNHFYESAIDVLIHADAAIDKLVGDEVTALFFPGFAGQEHARRAIDAAQELLRATGYKDRNGPWIPIGVGVHTGIAWVGAIGGADGKVDFTALGDNVNTTARLASRSASGEILVTEAACLAAHMDVAVLERRELELKGKNETVNVRVMHVN